jgi:hypothetical protein
MTSLPPPWHCRDCDDLVDLRNAEPRSLDHLICPWPCCGTPESRVYRTRADAMAALRRELLDLRADASQATLARIDKCISILDAGERKSSCIWRP